MKPLHNLLSIVKGDLAYQIETGSLRLFGDGKV